MRLHIDSFQYLEELESLFLSYYETDGFSKGFVNNEFRIAVIRIIIALHHDEKILA